MGGGSKNSYHASLPVSRMTPAWDLSVCRVMSCYTSTGPQAIQTRRRATSGQVLEAKHPPCPLSAYMMGSDASSRAIWIWLDINDIHSWTDRNSFVSIHFRTPLLSGPSKPGLCNPHLYLTCIKKVSRRQTWTRGAVERICGGGGWQEVNFHSVK